MYFDFEDNRPDTPRITQPISRREVVLVTINLHALMLIVILLGPKLPWVRDAIERQQQALEEQARLELERRRDQARFVFVQPRVDMTAKPPPRAELSDLDRQARTVERAPAPANPLPFSRGNSRERLEADPPATVRRPSPAPDPTPQNSDPEASKPSLTLPESLTARERPPDPSRQNESRGPAVGVIADAIRNVRRYAQQDTFGNLRGGQSPNVGESIQFDTKGVEFGPWLARFVAQVRSNWMIPQAAMSMHGNVAITFVVHKDGRITDVTVARPSTVDAFTLSGRNAILTSNPTIPLPPEYPDDKMPIMVTFYFNEEPPGR
jgi:TonB family protein